MSHDRHRLAAIFVGGCAGALSRGLLARALSHAVGTWPWATLAVNVAGALLLGLLAAHRRPGSPPGGHRWALLVTGFCGALTTFSAFQLELVQLADRGRYGEAAGYGAVSIATGLLALVLAEAAVRRSRQIR
jgi:CrcB protein